LNNAVIQLKDFTFLARLQQRRPHQKECRSMRKHTTYTSYKEELANGFVVVAVIRHFEHINQIINKTTRDGMC
jgi:hypothetical protein